MESHIKSFHEKSFDFECQYCGKKSASFHRLKNHIYQSHSHVTCELCGVKVANPSELKKHKVFVHKDTKGAWLCQKCPKKVFFTKTMFEKHLTSKH